jgi:transcriptional regulator MraZ
MLLGEHDHTLDDKNRLTLPAKLREHLGERVVITHGLDGCLSAYAQSDWERLSQRILELDPLGKESRLMRRHFFAGATTAELDRQGRMVVPAALLKSAGIDREVTVAGVYDHLEIWDRATWRAQQHEVEGSAEDVAERLANRD